MAICISMPYLVVVYLARQYMVPLAQATLWVGAICYISMSTEWLRHVVRIAKVKPVRV